MPTQIQESRRIPSCKGALLFHPGTKEVREMHGTFYRLNADTVGIISENQQRLAVLIPNGAVVTAINDPINGNRMVDVRWDGKTITLFTEDLRARGELVTVKVAAGSI